MSERRRSKDGAKDGYLRALKSLVGEEQYYKFKELLREFRRVDHLDNPTLEEVRQLGWRLHFIFDDEERRA